MPCMERLLGSLYKEKGRIMSIPVSKYRCQKCGFKFERETPEQVVCPVPECKSNYVDWLNSKEVLDWLHNRHVDFKNYRKRAENT